MGKAGALGFNQARAEDRIEKVLLDLNRKALTESSLDRLLEFVFEAFQGMIPYERLGIALLESESQVVRLRWMKSLMPAENLVAGYSASLKGSTLGEILRTGEPRIISDLEAYLQANPASESTRKAIRDGIKSSLTCPLLCAKGAVGFMFFSSQRKNCYDSVHVEMFKLVAAEVTTLVDRLAQASALRGSTLSNRFLSQVTHDLNNPIGIIRNLTDLMLSGDFGQLTEETRRAVLVLSRQSELLTHLVGDIQNLAAMNTSSYQLKKSPISLRTFFAEFIAAAQVLAKDKAIHLKIELERSMPVEACFDPHRINQVLANLLSNAVKFSKPGTEATLRVSGEGLWLKVEVQDQGPGIPVAEREKIFMPFGRTSVKPTGGESSTGLGLYICQQIVNAHGGDIGFRSDVGQGTTFTVRIPV